MTKLTIFTITVEVDQLPTVALEDVIGNYIIKKLNDIPFVNIAVVVDQCAVTNEVALIKPKKANDV